MKKKSMLGMLFLLVVSMGVAGQAAIITNGSFEDQGMFPYPGYNNGNTSLVITGWTYSGVGVGIAPSSYDGGKSTAFIYDVPIPDGSLVAFIFGAGSLSQNVQLDAGQYELSWYEALRRYETDAVSVPRTVSVTNSSNTVIQSSSANVSNKEAFALQTMTFTVPVSGTYTVSFASSGNTYLMDNVAITAVPEPVTIGLIALGGLVGLCRRNRA
jgi:hypothetical protein